MAETIRNNHYYPKGSSSCNLIKGDEGHRNMQFVDPELAITRNKALSGWCHLFILFVHPPWLATGRPPIIRSLAATCLFTSWETIQHCESKEILIYIYTGWTDHTKTKVFNKLRSLGIRILYFSRVFEKFNDSMGWACLLMNSYSAAFSILSDLNFKPLAILMRGESVRNQPGFHSFWVL